MLPRNLARHSTECDLTRCDLTEPLGQPDATTSFPTVGRWRVTALPSGWMYVNGFGIRQMTADPETIAANVSLGEDILDSENALPAYIEEQARLINHHLGSAKMAGPQPMAFRGADEAFLFFVRHAPEGLVSMLHAQTYVRSGRWVGIVTLTTPESELAIVRPDYDTFLRGLRIIPKDEN